MAVDESIKKISINYDNLGDIASTAIPAITSNIFGDIGGDSEWGRGLGTLFSQGSSSALGRMSSNLFKGNTLMEGVGHDALSSVAGAGVGLASYGIGQGINSLGGNSKLSRGIGAGVSTGLGIYGGNLVSNLLGKTSGVNPYGAAMTIAGSALGAAMGPSKEYNGTYGNVTRTIDSIYDVATAASNFLPGGQVISGAMALNKGLSNLFGSTSGMSRQDAILGSAFMPAPVKWLNMVGAHTTDTFKNLSWLNTEKADSFMLNAFGNLNTKFDKAREEAGKTYGTFSNGAYRRAQNNIEFANQAWNKILSMADLNELQTIRSLYMTSINNLRYALNIQGGWNPLARGKYGMKILNNATNHNMGMRLLSGAALIDDKQMILSALEGIKMRPPRMRAHRKGDLSRGLTEKELQLLAEYDTLRKKEIDEKVKAKQKADDEAAERFNQLTNTVMSAMTLQANETPFTGLEYLQAAELQRQEKVDKFHDAEKVVEATLMADMATAVAPLLRKGFRWAFNKAGLLVRVPKNVGFINPENSTSIKITEHLPDFSKMTREEKMLWLRTQQELALRVDLTRTLDALHMTKNRLKKGGFDRLRLALNNLFIPRSYVLDFLNDELTILRAKPIKGTSTLIENRLSKILGYRFPVNRSAGGVGVHKTGFSSIFTDYSKSKDELFWKINHHFDGMRKSNKGAAHEFVHYMYWPGSSPRGFKPSPGMTGKYLIGNIGEGSGEISARGTELKNYFGLKEGEELTPDMWNYAARHYLKDVGFNTATQEMFNTVPINSNYFFNWINKHAPSIVPTTGGLTAATLYNSNK